jgi:hypothetical protein
MHFFVLAPTRHWDAGSHTRIYACSVTTRLIRIKSPRAADAGSCRRDSGAHLEVASPSPRIDQYQDVQPCLSLAVARAGGVASGANAIGAQALAKCGVLPTRLFRRFRMT